jgi:hypothetical protein
MGEINGTMKSDAMKEPATAPWDLRISYKDFIKLRAGFIPTDMDDKWYFYATAQEAPFSVHIVRSAFNYDCYILDIVLKLADDGIGKIGQIVSITWETTRLGYSEEVVKKEAVGIIRSVLFCDLDCALEYD